MNQPVRLITRVSVSAGLGYDAYAHADLAASFDANRALISQGTLFRAEAVAAVLAGLLVLFMRHRAAALFALLIAGSALGAVLLYRYVDLGAVGPLPDMYEPSWYLEKNSSAVAEAIALLAAAALLFCHDGKRWPSARLMPGGGPPTGDLLGHFREC